MKFAKSKILKKPKTILKRLTLFDIIKLKRVKNPQKFLERL
tara:strand:+ start:378 stop:500 length:123 start_codon:yes stop_codon:yes gene_type:complete